MVSMNWVYIYILSTKTNFPFRHENELFRNFLLEKLHEHEHVPNAWNT